MRRNATFAAALGALVLLVAGCGGSKKSSSTKEATEGGTTTIGGVSANDHGMKSVSGTTEVELDDYYFEPTVLKGKPGAKVTLELKNKGSVEHNFTLAAQGIDKDLEAGATAKVAVTIPKSGELSFYCKYHKSMGMAGALESTAGGSGSGGMQTGTTTGGKGGY
jgi:plastocyanin